MLKNMRLMLTAFGVIAVGLGGNADAAVKKTTTAKQAAIQKGTSYMLEIGRLQAFVCLTFVPAVEYDVVGVGGRDF